MKKYLKACDNCDKKFAAIVPTQLYCTATCRNRAAQKRLRARAKGK